MMNLKAERHLGGVTSSKTLEPFEELWEKENKNQRKRGSDLFKEVDVSVKKYYKHYYITTV